MRLAAVLLPLALVIAVVVTQATAAKQPPRDINAGDFAAQKWDRSATIDNRWFPQTPGTHSVYIGATSEGNKRIGHRLLVTVTDLTKVIGGVRSVVLWERDYSAGQLVESELAFFAQDNGGNVWLTGEYPEEYEDGKFVKAPAWLHGVKGATAGLAMRVHPRLKTPSYAQGFAPPPVKWTDRAQVKQMGLRTCVAYDCFENVMRIDEFNPDQPGKQQQKYYAPGVGTILVGWAGKNDEGRETLALVERTKLGPAAMAKIRAEAFKLERHGYKVSKAVYGTTEPLQRR